MKPSHQQHPPLPSYQTILLAVDASDHANRANLDAVALAQGWGSAISAVHVYAASLHDQRFRQMEGGLPEQFREEQELERQREVHDDLISRGLSIISDAYLDQSAECCAAQQIPYTRIALEGKNYRELSREANSGRHELLVMGALGLGALPGSDLGSVTARLSRRSNIDTLVIRQPERPLNSGPIVVAIDGSAQAYGALLTGLTLAQQWQQPLQVISAFDPYYHYVAFNRIASVLSEAAGKVFRFQEQEQLHEEIIDSGLAKIYQGHLDIAQGLADDHGIPITTQLLDGKPHHAILRYLQQQQPALLLMGKVGIHADVGLDIGSNSEQLLRHAPCAVWLCQRSFQPPVELIASITTSWTHEAEARLQRAPSFVQGMARMAILRFAQQRGHTVITESIVVEATAQLMPSHAEQALGEIVSAHDRGDLKVPSPLPWAKAATDLLRSITEPSLQAQAALRAEKMARSEGYPQVELHHIAAFTEATTKPTPESVTEQDLTPPTLHWQAAALARLARVPEGFMRDGARQQIEAHAHKQKLTQITLQVAEQGLASARQGMAAMQGGQAEPAPATTAAATPSWSAAAKEMLQAVPEGFSRDMSFKAVAAIALHNGVTTIDSDFVASVLQAIRAGSAAVTTTQPWDEAARQRLARVPSAIAGMLMQEIEGWATRHAITPISVAVVEQVIAEWQQQGRFHLDPHDPRHRP